MKKNEVAMSAHTVNISETERWLSSIAGAAMILSGLKQRSVVGALRAASGAALLTRGASGYCPAYASVGRSYSRVYDTREALGGRCGVHVDESITINRPAADVWAIWRDFESLPNYIPSLKSVTRTDATRFHWEAIGPGRRSIAWDAEILNEIPNELIAWRTIGEPDVVSAGSVRFVQSKGRGDTQVHVRLQYEPAGGKSTAAIAWLFGKEPGQLIRAGLRRFKAIIETGEAPTTAGQAHGKRSLLHYAQRSHA